MTPTIGRIVHYYSYGTPGGEYLPEPRAAIITATPDKDALDNNEPWVGFRLDPMTVSLAVLNPTGMFFNEKVRFSETPKPGHWSWPARVEAVSA